MLDQASQTTVALMVLTTAGLFLVGDLRLMRIGIIMLLTWALCEGWVQATGDYYAWYWFAAVDTAGMWAVTRKPYTYTAVFVGGLYLTQILWHALYAINLRDGDVYLNALDWLGRAQLAALITGGGVGLVWRVHRYRRVSAARSMAVG